jgi:hypothetical protein
MLLFRRPQINHGGLTEVGIVDISDRLRNYSVCMQQEEKFMGRTLFLDKSWAQNGHRG